MLYTMQWVAITMFILSAGVTQLAHANQDPMICSPDTSAQGCTIFSKCRSAADLWVSCRNKKGAGVDGYINSSSAELQALRITFSTSGSSRIENGKFVAGLTRDLKPMTVDIGSLPFSVEDLYFKRDEVNKYLKDTFNLPGLEPINSNNPSQNSTFQLVLKNGTPVYQDPRATQAAASITPSSSASELHCSWSISEPVVNRPKCGGSTPAVCQGKALCWRGSSSKDNPPRSYEVSCDSVNGACPSATACANAPEPSASGAGSGVGGKCFSKPDANYKNQGAQ